MTNNDYYIELTVSSDDTDPELIEDQFDAIADAFHECTGIEDQDLAANLEEQTLTFSMAIEDVSDENRAKIHALTAVRSALHAAGAATPGWDDQIRYLVTGTTSAQDLLDA